MNDFTIKDIDNGDAGCLRLVDIDQSSPVSRGSLELALSHRNLTNFCECRCVDHRQTAAVAINGDKRFRFWLVDECIRIVPVLLWWRPDDDFMNQAARM